MTGDGLGAYLLEVELFGRLLWFVSLDVFRFISRLMSVGHSVLGLNVGHRCLTYGSHFENIL
jgi:hypothetical protein